MGIGNSFLLQSLVDSVWAMNPTTLNTLSSVVVEKVINGSVSRVKEPSAEEEELVVEQQDGVAVLNISGVLTPQASYIDSLCGMESTLDLHQRYKELVADSSVKRIVLLVNSPGGVITGIQEFAETIYNSREVKETVAYVDVQSASAAYWLASACEHIIVQPSATIGSIGTYILVPKNKMSDQDYTMHIFQAGKKKLYGFSDAEMTSEEEEYFSSRVQKANADFLSAVAKHRDVSVEEVKNLEAGHFMAKNAPKWLYSKIGVLEDALYN
jgi:signal peptide peptidase SppA